MKVVVNGEPSLSVGASHGHLQRQILCSAQYNICLSVHETNTRSLLTDKQNGKYSGGQHGLL